MSLFKGIADASMQRDSEFIRPGRYLCRIDRFSTGKTRKNIEFVVFNLQVLHVIDDTAAADSPKGAHKIGDKLSWMIMGDWDSFASSVKTAIVNITGCDPSEVTEETCAQMTSNAQPLAGTFVEIDAQNVTTRAGKVFTRVQAKRAISEDEVKSTVPAQVLASLRINL